MDIGGADAESGIDLAEPVDVDVGDHVHRRSGSGIPKDSLEVRLDSHVGSFVAIKHSDSLISRNSSRTVLRYSLVSRHCSLDQRCEDGDYQRRVRIFLVGVRVQIRPQLSRRNCKRRG